MKNYVIVGRFSNAQSSKFRLKKSKVEWFIFGIFLYVLVAKINSCCWAKDGLIAIYRINPRECSAFHFLLDFSKTKILWEAWLLSSIVAENLLTRGLQLCLLGSKKFMTLESMVGQSRADSFQPTDQRCFATEMSDGRSLKSETRRTWWIFRENEKLSIMDTSQSKLCQFCTYV